ncbi:hypothetical protein OPT61_g7554 [Boeremia exigua]|uniref:Uncharacterized protein n=1 Tax=Boeremia exigua TaxID=749465 RepID=A0ACC2I2V6_9PLEO|nr:hypothetical protein OPT61_g7554 [Boeremia exigua]
MEHNASLVDEKAQASGPKRTFSRVPAACQRCRQQKLKALPLLLSTTWKVHEAGRPAKKTRRNERPTVATSDLEPTPCTSPSVRSSSLAQTNEANEGIDANDFVASSDSQVENGAWAKDSASIQYLEQHETTSPNAEETSSFAARQQLEAPGPIPGPDASPGLPFDMTSRHQSALSGPSTQSMRADILSVLPTHDIALSLVNNYFDRIHWFVLVFHQSDFRQRFKVLYEELALHSECRNTSISFFGVFIAVCILSLSYMDREQTSRLNHLGEDGTLLQARLLAVLQSKLLDIASEGSIEAVQACVLLGSYFVYHGQPQSAWLVCGWSLRIAQALKLHRRSNTESIGVPDLDNTSQRAEETRKRCWWAVYEIETFCSMLYGYPLSINDDDCDVEPLHQYPERSKDPAWDVTLWRDKGQATLLSFKFAMARLSIIVRAALSELYSLDVNNPRWNARESNASHRIHSLTEKVTSLDTKLHAWASQLPQELRIEHPSLGTAIPCKDYLQSQPGLCANACSHYLFPLQSISLKLSFENARILIHRPLLSYRMSMSQPHIDFPCKRTPDPCQHSVQTCQNAALQISASCSSPIVKDAAATYAVAFVCLHLLTASITLSIVALLKSMTPASLECKMGLRRLMEMQSHLSGRSLVAKQGFAVSKRLMSLLLEKEMKQMLDVSGHDEILDQASEVEQDVPTPTRTTHYGPLFTGSRNATSDDEALDSNPSFSAVPIFDNDPIFTFYEDLTTTQTLADFEQGMLEYGNMSRQDAELCIAVLQFPDATLMDQHANADPQTDATFGGQDYSWIWSCNLDPYLR